MKNNVNRQNRNTRNKHIRYQISGQKIGTVAKVFTAVTDNALMPQEISLGTS